MSAPWMRAPSCARVVAFAIGLAVVGIGGRAAAASDDLPDQTFGVTGDWGGLRTRLKSSGWTFQIREKWEGAGNASGGARQAWTGASELRLGATADLQTLLGIPHAAIQVTLTHRAGASFGPAAGLNSLQPFVEVHGRGDKWRLTHLWYEQSFADGSVDLKVGRVNPGIDFDAFSCGFQNLTFCGSQPGNLVGRYWYNYPVSQWGGRIKLSGRSGLYAEAGVYEVNPQNLRNGFNLSFHGSRGALVPVELGWAAKLGPGKLPGTWLVGGWESDVTGPDVFYDVNRAPKMITGAPALVRRGRFGGYLSIEQQVTGKANGRGLSLFVNATQADRRTSRLDRQIAFGATYKGLIPGRPNDDLALAIGATHVNSRLSAGEALAWVAGLSSRPPQHSEYAGELDYRFRPTAGLTVTPNLQVVRQVGGVKDRDAAVVGLKVIVSL